MVVVPERHDLGRMTTETLRDILADSVPAAVLLPVGSVEPHGPHMALVTDTVISQAACIGAALDIEAAGVRVLIAPPVGYGVTDCAAAFPGAVSIPAATLTAFLRAIVTGFLDDGFAHVCLVNNHLEPAHDVAVREAIRGTEPDRASVACPLTRRWGKTLDDEYKRGECHAGHYETSIMLAAAPELVDDKRRRELPEIPVSLSEALTAGTNDFMEMGLTAAYAGAPASANAAHGREMISALSRMVRVEVLEAMGAGESGA